MLIQEALKRAVEASRSVKEDHVRRVKGKPGMTDIMTVIDCYRGDERVATIFHQPDRDRMLQVAQLAAVGFGADVVAITMETFKTHLPNNPVTGEAWGAGEVGQVAAEHDGIAQGWVNEALVTHVVNRAGDARQVVRAYLLHGRSVEWLDSFDSGDEGASVEGYVVDVLADAMCRATVGQQLGRLGLAADGSGMSIEQMLAHSDVATVSALESRLGADNLLIMLVTEPGSPRAQVIRERFPAARVLKD